MFDRLCMAAALVAASTLLSAAPASAQGEIVITQAKANAGNVTPGDTPGFPVTLSLPGAYVLGSNLQVPAGQFGIYVRSHNVDIDMNGFRLSGANSSGAPVGTYGLYSPFGQSRIHDGTITQFRNDGLRLTGNVNAWTIENMQIVENLGAGIYAPASAYARFINSSVIANGADGILCGHYCHVEGSTVSGNGGYGILLGDGTVLGSTLFSNRFYGVYDYATPGDDTGIGNNTISGNNGGSQQTYNTAPLFPNVCVPDSCL